MKIRYNRVDFNPMKFKRDGVYNLYYKGIRFDFIRCQKRFSIRCFSEKVLPSSDLPQIQVVERMDMVAVNISELGISPYGTATFSTIDNTKKQYRSEIKFERLLRNEYDYLVATNNPRHTLFDAIPISYKGEELKYYNRVQFLDDLEEVLEKMFSEVTEENKKVKSLQSRYGL